MSRAWLLPVAICAALGASASVAAQPAAPTSLGDANVAEAFAKAQARVTWKVQIGSPENDDGTHLELKWTAEGGDDKQNAKVKVIVLRRMLEPTERAEPGQAPVAYDGASTIEPSFLYPSFIGGHYPSLQPESAYFLSAYDAFAQPITVGQALGEWTVIAVGPDAPEVVDEVDPRYRYTYALLRALPREDGQPGFAAFVNQAALTGAAQAQAAGFHTGRWFFLAFIGIAAAALLLYMKIAKQRGDKLFIRRIPGVDAIEDAVGRSTEMGRPVLYVTGVEQITDLQTIASVLILGKVAEMTAEYDTELKVANAYPMTMVVAEEIVRNGYANVGRLDAHKPDNIMFITSEQFAFAAAVNGMILRERPATNIYLGRFFAESLILSETGFLTGAVQIAGTAEFTQLPFFIAACDYTLIGEELYATSAYLSRDPNQLAQLKAADVMKVVCAILILLGVIGVMSGEFDLVGWLKL